MSRRPTTTPAPKAGEVRRPFPVTFNCTLDERQAIIDVASEAGLSVAAYIRGVVFVDGVDETPMRKRMAPRGEGGRFRPSEVSQ